MKCRYCEIPVRVFKSERKFGFVVTVFECPQCKTLSSTVAPEVKEPRYAGR